jgi:hypothetical protein
LGGGFDAETRRRRDRRGEDYCEFERGIQLGAGEAATTSVETGSVLTFRRPGATLLR